MNGLPSGAKVAVLFVALAVLAALGATSLPVLTRSGVESPLTAPVDFVAFYCAGRVAATGADPYRAEPLRTCERGALAESHLAAIPHLVVPAPLPPYALALFGVARWMPFRLAAGAWFAVLVLALCTTIFALHRLTGFSPIGLTLIVVPAEAIGSLLLGQLVPLVVCALALAALALRAERPWTAAAALCVASLEPHVALAAWIGAFALVPRARIPLATFGVALLAGSLASGGIQRNAEYLFTVLPAHAREGAFDVAAQYSLAAVLWTFGTPLPTAVHIGAISYALALIAGLILTRRLVLRTGDAAFAVLAPPAVTLIGGAFVHLQQMLVALPLGLLLLARLRSALPAREDDLWWSPLRGALGSPVVLGAVAALIVPWPLLAGFVPQPPVFVHAVRPDPAALVPVDGAVRLAQDTWQTWLAARDRLDPRATSLALILKLPTWCALLALAVCAWRVTDARRANAAARAVSSAQAARARSFAS